ncbi:MAG TPA: ROK family protein [Gaiellaceae bacterium]|nr:ROK family protein [Gaiellaceae bacterium]
MSTTRVIGVDLGGTKILAGVIDGGRVLETVEQPTPTTSQEALLDGVAAAVRELPLEGVSAVGFGIPSRFDYRTGQALGAVNIPLGQVDFAGELERRLGLPVGVENDASCAAYGEHVHGAGRGTSYFGTLTLGTGVGGGIIFAGKLLHAWTELGHMVIVADGEPCQGACSGRGHVEAYCSGTAATKLAREAIGPQATAHDLVESHHPALASIGHYLGVAIGSLVNIFGLERIAIGGGFGVAAFEQLLPAARMAVLREVLGDGGRDLQIECAELGEAAGMIGAGLVALEAR